MLSIVDRYDVDRICIDFFIALQNWISTVYTALPLLSDIWSCLQAAYQNPSPLQVILYSLTNYFALPLGSKPELSCLIGLIIRA